MNVSNSYCPSVSEEGYLHPPTQGGRREDDERGNHARERLHLGGEEHEVSTS